MLSAEVVDIPCFNASCVLRACVCKQGEVGVLSVGCMQALPAYLRSEIVFGEAQRPKLLARIMEALGSLALRRARETGRHD